MLPSQCLEYQSNSTSTCHAELMRVCSKIYKKQGGWVAEDRGQRTEDRGQAEHVVCVEYAKRLMARLYSHQH